MSDLLQIERPTDMTPLKGYSTKAMAMAAQTMAAKAQDGPVSARVQTTGTEFETMVLSQLLKPMFEGLSSDGMFGGGEGEEAFKSVYIDAIAKQITQSGGVGISATVQKELIRMQAAQTSGQAS